MSCEALRSRARFTSFNTPAFLLPLPLPFLPAARASAFHSCRSCSSLPEATRALASGANPTIYLYRRRLKQRKRRIQRAYVGDDARCASAVRGNRPPWKAKPSRPRRAATTASQGCFRRCAQDGRAFVDGCTAWLRHHRRSTWTASEASLNQLEMRGASTSLCPHRHHRASPPLARLTQPQSKLLPPQRSPPSGPHAVRAE